MNKDYLIKRYQVELASTKEIANENNCSEGKIRYWLHKHNIHIIPHFVRKTKVLTGKKFGLLTILHQAESSKHGTRWHCKCDCGAIKIVNTRCLRSGDAVTCGNNSVHKYKGCGQLSQTYFSQLQTRALKRGLEFSVSKDFLWSLFIKQNGECALSGIAIKLLRSFKDGRKEHTASLDRIDSSKGYTENNVQWVHKVVNSMKRNFPQKEFIEWCKKIASNSDEVTQS